MNFQFIVNVEVERVQGKFASKDDIADKIREALTDADPGNITSDNDAEYETTNWEVNDA